MKYGDSVAKILRSNKGKVVGLASKSLKETVSEVKVTPKTKIKTTAVGQKKSWSKVKVKSTAERFRKRKVISSSESEYDVEKDVQNIIPAASRKSAGKKIMLTVENVPIDKWRFIYHRRLALERELGKEAQEIKVVMELIKEVGLMKTMCNLGECYEQLVKEFLVNIPDDCDSPISSAYQKAFVLGECVNFSPTTINKFLGVEEINNPKLEVTDDQVCNEITEKQVKMLPKKKKISFGKLFVKYAILNIIIVVNWVPTTHSSDVGTR